MEHIYRIAIISIIAAVACLVLKHRAGELGVMLSMAAVILVVLLSARFIKPVFTLFLRLCALADLREEVSSPLIKSVGIGLLTKMTGSICEDAGEKGLSSAVDFAGGILSMYIALPLISSVLALMEELGA